MAEYVDYFDQILADYIDSASLEILELEKLFLDIESGQKSTECLKQIKRILHSIKGSAGSLGFHGVSETAHRFEEFVYSRRDQTLLKDDFIQSFSYIDSLKKFTESKEDIEVSTPQKQTHELVNKKILVVEQSITNRKILHEALNGFPVDIKVEKDALMALSRVAKEKFDTIILSTNVTGLDGLKLLKCLKVIEGLNKNTPIILVTTRQKIELSAEYQPDHHLCWDIKLIKKLRQVIKDDLNIEDESQLLEDFPYKKILMVDDEAGVHELLDFAFLEIPEVQFTHCYSCKEGLEAFKKDKPDLIICDFNLREETGDELLYAVEKEVRAGEVPFVFLTSEDMKQRANLKKAAGIASGVIQKPFDWQKIAKTIASLLKVTPRVERKTA